MFSLPHLLSSLAVVASGLAATAAPAAEPTGAPTHHAAARANVSWGSTTLVPGGSGYAISGRLKGKRKVLLQYKAGGAWRTLDRDRARKGRYSFTGSWEWYGVHKVRLYAPRSKGRRSKAKTLGRTTFNVSPGYLPRGLPSEFTPFNDNGRVYSFNPCRPITWRFNSGGGAGDFLFGQVQSAITEISRATGIEFRYAGTSQTIPLNVTMLEPGTDLVVAFANPAQAPGLEAATALGGIVRATVGTAGKRQVWRIMEAGLTLNSERLLSGSYSFEESSASPTTKLVFMHELGHAMGLNHVTTPGSETQVMFSGSTYMAPWEDGLHHPRWGTGDLAGLSYLGMGSGCVK